MPKKDKENIAKQARISPDVLKARKEKVRTIIKTLNKLDPDPKVALDHKEPWQLLVAVQLAAQCTDKLVNTVTPELFRKYPEISDIANAKQISLEKDLRKVTFFRNKTRNLIGAANKIIADFNGKVPKSMDELTSIPGVGRKSANVILSNAFGISEGIAVDTHVWRLSRMLGLSNQNDPEKIERDLMVIMPKKDWHLFTYLLIDYGRTYCPGRKHDHEKKECPLRALYVRDTK